MAEAPLELARLCHAVVAPGVEERLRIQLRDIQLPGAGAEGNGSRLAMTDLRCKAYVGPQASLNEGPDGRPDKARLREVRLEIHDDTASAEVEVGVPSPQELWGLRIKLYHRPAASLFAQEKVAEVVEAVPRPPSRVQLLPSLIGLRPGSAVLEVLRVVPLTARGALEDEAGRVLVRAVNAGVEAEDVEELCAGTRELGPSAMLAESASKALVSAAGMGKGAVLEKLLDAGVMPSITAAQEAERQEHLDMACLVLQRCGSPDPEASLLERALLGKLPAVAEMLMTKDPRALDQLPSDGNAARQAHAAGAWTVLAALLVRGDPMPVPARELLTYALRAGHVRLARACLACNEDLGDMEAALRTCLDHGRVEIVREALEAQWRVRSSQWSKSSGPPLLVLECGPADEPAECGVCFEPLHRNPGVFLGDHGFRTCAHFCCLDCAEHVQDEANDRLRLWRNRRDTRLPQPPGPMCPLCRAPFASAARLTDPTIDPRIFFKLAAMPEESARGGARDPSAAAEASATVLLRERMALGALCALLPVNGAAFAPRLKQELWPAWCADASEPDALAEADFLRPGGMLAWLSDHLLELKVEKQRGSPPRLQDNSTAWFRYFDFDGKVRLTKPELLRGIAKANDVAVLASPTTPACRARSVGVQRLREIVDAVWDEARWAGGVPLSDFEGRGGFAERLLAALPGDMPPAKRASNGDAVALDVEAALAKARDRDFEAHEEDVKRARERDEKKRQAQFQLAGRDLQHRTLGSAQRNGGQPGRAGAELLLASLLEAARDGGRPAPNIRIQCPFCQAINAARAGPNQRVICGNCRSIFAVPATVLPG